jgi:hypothetical protein
MTRRDPQDNDTNVDQLGSSRQIPSQGAIDALAEVVRRAREAADTAGTAPKVRARPAPEDAPRIPAEPPVAPTTAAAAAGADDAGLDTQPLGKVEPESLVFVDPTPPAALRRRSAPAPRSGDGARRSARPRPAPRWLVIVVGVAAATAVVLGSIDVALALSGNNSPSSGTRTHAAAAPPTHPPVTHQSPSSTTPPSTSPPSTSQANSPTSALPATTAPIVTAGTRAPTTGPPQLTSISPPHGRPGSVIAVHGRNLFSPTNGVILARVNGQPAPTDCPTQTSCQVTIPDLSRRSKTVSVTVTTDSGTSNPLLFRYV